MNNTVDKTGNNASTDADIGEQKNFDATKKRKPFIRKAKKNTVKKPLFEKNSAKNEVNKNDNQPVFLQAVSLLVLVLCVGSAIAIIKQVNQYRISFNESKSLKKQENQLNTQWHKLLLEQQTYGTTARVGSRAVSNLGMFEPQPEQTYTIDLSGIADYKNSVIQQNSSQQDALENNIIEHDSLVTETIENND